MAFRFVTSGEVRLKIADGAARLLRDAREKLADLGRTLDKDTNKTPEAKARELATQRDLVLMLEARLAQAEAAGDWITVHKELNITEHRKLLSRMFKDLYAGEKAGVNTEEIGRAKVVAYLTGWSAPEPYSLAALDNLAVEDFQEIAATIDVHEEAVNEEKKSMVGVTSS